MNIYKKLDQHMRKYPITWFGITILGGVLVGRIIVEILIKIIE